MKKIFISVGDPSADRHAANLMKEIKLLLPDVKFIGIGGESMIKEGLDSIANLKDISVVGFWEVAKKYIFFNNLFKQSFELLQKEKIDLFLPVDYPGFNIRLAKKAKILNIKVIYYIAPQLWAWGKNRAIHLKDSIDLLLVVFPFELDYFRNFGINSIFVGHPLLDYEEFNIKIKNYNERDELIAFLPGSRTQEVIRHKKFIIGLAKELELNLPNYKIAVSQSKHLDNKLFSDIQKIDNITIEKDTYKLFQTAKAGIIKTGTSNLEAALSGLPFVMFYRTSLITYYLAKKMINLPYISIINILKNKLIVKELIQNDANEKNIIKNVKELIENQDYYNYIQNEFKEIRTYLGNFEAAKNAAKIICDNL